MNAPATVKGDSLATAMAAAFAKIEAATKSANNPHFKSKYADLGAVIDAVKPALIEHGLFFVQCPRPSDGGVCVETVLHHASGESISLGTLFVPANKQDAQGFGSALTYARRYGLMTAFGVPAEDDDGNAAAASVRQAPKADTVRMATDAQCALIMTLAPAVGMTVQGIVEAYKVSALDELTEAKAAAAIKSLESRKAAVANA